MNRRGSTAKRYSKEGLRPVINPSRNHEEFSAQPKDKDEAKSNLSHSEHTTEKNINCESEPKTTKSPKEASTTATTPHPCRISSSSPDLNQPRKLSLSQSESSLVTLGRQTSSTNLSWFKPVITGSLEFSKTSLSLPGNAKDEKPKSLHFSDENRNSLVTSIQTGNVTKINFS